MHLEYLEGFASLLAPRQELRSQTNFTRTLTLSDGNIMLNSRSEESGIFSRAWENGSYGVCSYPGFENDNVYKVIKAAKDNALTLSRFKRDFKPLPVPVKGRLAAKAEFIDPAQEELLNFAKEIDAVIIKNCPGLINRIVRIVVECTKTQLYIAEGTSFERVLPRAHLFITLTTKDNSGKPVSLSTRVGGGGNFCKYFSNADSLEKDINELYEMLMDKKEGVYAEAGYTDAVIGTNLAGILAHEAVGHTTESDLVRSGSIAAHYRNEQIANSKVTLTDFAHTAFGEEAPMPIYVDDEGTPGQDVEIIKNGILLDYMTNLQDSPYINASPKGNGRAFSYSDEPLVRMRNTCILPGSDSLNDMIASIDKGYYLIKNSNGQADSTSEFMFGITMGYEIINGKLGRAIKDTTISGKAFDLLKTIDMVGKDIVWAAGGYCGKKTPLGNAMGGPAVKCKLHIGGR